MKIVHFIFSLSVGGAENLLVDIANEQSKTEEVSIVVVKNEYNQRILERISDRIEIYILTRKRKTTISPFIILKIFGFFSKIKPDVVHCHSINCYFLIPLFMRKAVLTVHNVNYNVRNIKKYAKIFAISEAVKNDILVRASLKSDVIYNGIFFEEVMKRKEFIIPKGSVFKIIQVGRLRLQKGQDLMLKVLKLLVFKRGFINIVLDFVGEGEEEDELRRIVEKNNLGPYVNFLGVRDREWVYRNLCTYHVLVQPSRYEGFGLTAIEAIAALIPIVAYNVDGLGEILGNLPTCYLAKKGDFEDFADGLVSTFNLYKLTELAKEVEKSYNICRERFSLEAVALNYIEKYKSIG